ncbi:thioredoxin family protein [Frankia sp. Mgl5]|uniref:thioredoxin family protein n=1 Tax=Frankia sp. Mgl5 TaxID=2933793 RepID=UPI00200C75F3|nr:thioredoxin family protein [Frankia sp. Mgl5]MCK9925625.1 thioredoxin family protein [Frankia sp. Mgl5]
MTGVWVLLAALVAATGVGLLTRARDGRFRVSRVRGGPRGAAARRGDQHGGGEREGRGDAGPAAVTGVGAVPGPDPGDHRPEAPGETAPGETARGGRGGLTAELAALGHVPGEVATLLQFSTAFCAPCRVARRVLADVAAIVPGVRHVEVDAESHLELVRRLGVRRTPTVLVLDAEGVEARRASGAPPSRDAVLATLASLVEPAPGDHRKGTDGDSVGLSGNA